MKKVALLCASPKKNDSASKEALQVLQKFLDRSILGEYSLNLPQIDQTLEEEILKCDILVFAFPLYVDGIPSHLLQCLKQLEKSCTDNQIQKKVYAVINCGFYEGKQNVNALSMMKNWCDKAGMIWCGGLGIGGGGMLPMMQKYMNGRGPLYSTWKALEHIAGAIQAEESLDIIYTTPDFPRFLYILAAHFGCRQMAKGNGLTRKDLNQRLV